MPSLGSILSTASTALKVHRENLGVISHNISNAGTEGYTRQRLVATANDPLVTTDGIFGTGLKSINVTQVRDRFVDAQFRRANGFAAHSGTRQSTLGRVEALFNEPSDSAIASQLDRFFSAFSELATNPTSPIVRTVVMAESGELARRFNALSGELDVLRTDAEARMDSNLDQVNSLLNRVAELNREIVASEAGERTAGDLRDVRDNALDELSSLIPINVIEAENGGVGVLAEGVLLLDGNRTNQLEIRDNAGTLELGIVGRTTVIDTSGGSIGGELQTLNQDLPGIRSALDTLVNEIVTSVNAIHQTGTSPDGSTGLDFFDPAGVTASAFAVSPTLTNDQIAAGVASGTGAYQAGDNSLALDIAALRDTAAVALGGTPGGFYREIVADVGRLIRFARDEGAVQGTLARQANATRMSVSGVSIDEELVQMIQVQTAFGAAARVIGVADEMMNTLVNL